jgi:chemotaxis protein MotB
MAKRKIEEEHVNHERWLVSYADFITLLFAFFVVMYSISQVNEGKYRILSNTLSDAFNSASPIYTPTTKQAAGGTDLSSIVDMEMPVMREPGAETNKPPDPDMKEMEMGRLDKSQMDKKLHAASEQVEEALKPLIHEGLVNLRGNEEWLEIELSSSLLFASAEATLKGEAGSILRELALIVSDLDYPVRVEGFTDNIPINTERFPSNWQLSTARASAVVDLFVEQGVPPNRLAAIGYGEYQAIADNSTPEGRAANRRVVLMISKTGELRPKLRDLTNDEEPAEENNQTGDAEKPVEKTAAPAVNPESANPQQEIPPVQQDTQQQTNSSETGGT